MIFMEQCLNWFGLIPLFTTDLNWISLFWRWEILFFILLLLIIIFIISTKGLLGAWIFILTWLGWRILIDDAFWDKPLELSIPLWFWWAIWAIKVTPFYIILLQFLNGLWESNFMIIWVIDINIKEGWFIHHQFFNQLSFLYVHLSIKPSGLLLLLSMLLHGFDIVIKILLHVRVKYFNNDKNLILFAYKYMLNIRNN